MINAHNMEKLKPKGTTLSIAQQAPVGQDLLIIKVLRLHSDTPQSVGLLRTSEQPYAGTST